MLLQQLYNILYTVSTQQHQYSNIMYVVGKLISRTLHRVLAVAALDKRLSMV